MPDHPSHADIDRAVTGDPKAIERLLEHYLDRLRAFVRLRTGERIREYESTSDLVQSVCRQVLETAPEFEFRGEPEFRAWLFTAASNKIRERARALGAKKRDRDREVHGDDGVLEAYGAILPTPSQIAIGHEQRERLERAFDQLTPQNREVLTLSRIAQLPAKEIAAHQGRSEGAVRNAIARALAQLSGLLDRQSRNRD